MIPSVIRYALSQLINPPQRSLREGIPRILYVAVRTSPSEDRSQQGYHIKIPAGPAGFLRQQRYAKAPCDIRGSLNRHHCSYRRSIEVRQFSQNERYCCVEVCFGHERDTHTCF